MKRTSNAYKLAMAKQYRGHSYMVVSLGIISNEAQASAKVTSDTLYLSDNNSLFKSKGLEGEYASFEENSILADGKTIFPPEDNEYFQRVISCAAISEDIQGAITVQFDNTYDIKGLTIGFGDNYPTAFNLIVNDTDATAYTNASETFETMDVFNGVNKLSIEPVSFIHGNNKRLRIEQMLMGVGLVFQNTDIQDANMEDATSFISEELPQLDFELVCLDRYKRFNIDDQNSFIHYLETGQRLNTSMGLELEDGSIEWVKMAPTYLTNWSSDSAKVTLRAADKFRVFLEGKYEAGNYIHTRTAYDEADRVFRDAGLEPDEYIIDDILRNITLVNPMPVVSHGEALQLLANCARCALKQDSNGRIIIFANFENIVEPTDITVDTDTQAAWSKPDNIRVGSNIVYADFTKDFVSADGSMYFLPENGESYLETGYVSKQIADDNGNFFDNIIEPPYDTQMMGNPRSWNGLTCTVNEDGSIHIQGTCTANTWYSFFNNNTARRYMPVEDCPWTVGDIIECDYFLEGTSQGNMGITCGYKTLDSSANQGYTNYRNLPCNFTNSKYVMSDKKVQTIDPRVDKEGMYWTSFIYIQSGCVCDVVVKPMLTVRKTLGNILAHNHYRLGYGGVNNTWTHQGVAYTFLDDGGILINGTATAESVCELINPYAPAHRLTLEVGHTYKMSEGREITTWHRNPFLQLVRYNATSNSYDYTYHTGNNGTIEFTQTNENLVSYGMRIVVASGATVDNVVLYPSLIDVDSYDENELNPTTYVYGKKPSLTMELPASYTYYGLNMKFGGNPPRELAVNVYQSGELADTHVIENPTQDYVLRTELYKFDKLEIVFNKAEPNNRAVLQSVSFGDLTDYRLTKSDMKKHPIGTLQTKIRDVRVKVFTYVEETTEVDGEEVVTAHEVEDAVYYTKNINPTGEVITFENPLINTMQQAEQLAEWLANYYANPITYQVDFRGEPRLESGDYIYMESDVANNLQCEVDSCTLHYNGAISGRLSLRRAINMINS